MTELLTASRSVEAGSEDARLVDITNLKLEMRERFHLYTEIQALSEGDRDALFRLLWDAQAGDPRALAAIFSLVYEEVPVGIEEFVLGRRYLGLKGQINIEKMEVLHLLTEPHRRMGYLGIGSGGGKALALDTPIPTPTGWTTMGEVAVGDQVLDEWERPCGVVAVTDVMVGRPCYAVHFDRGRSSIVADGAHQWVVQTARGVDWLPAQVVTTEFLGRSLGVHSIWCPARRVRYRITALERIDSVPVRCIQVDSPSHCYLAGRSKVPTHNSFVVSILLAYQIYQLLCLRRPDLFYCLGPGSKIAAINLSINKKQAQDVVFSEFVARISHAPWFAGKYTALLSKAFFPKNGQPEAIAAISGGASPTAYYGYHTIFGAIDEASFLMDGERCLAEELTEALKKSLATRFPRAYRLVIISTFRAPEDFLYQEIQRIRENGVCLRAT